MLSLNDPPKMVHRSTLNEFEEHQKITVSGGVAQYEQGADVDFIDRADQKLYLAKQRGKNQVVSEVSE